MRRGDLDARDWNADEVRTTKPSYRLFAVSAMVLSSVCGSFLAPSMLLALNYKRLGRPISALGALLAGLAGLVLHLRYISSLNPDSPLNAAVYVVLPPILVYPLARLLQGRALLIHRNSGGALGSIALAIWLGVACGAAIMWIQTRA